MRPTPTWESIARVAAFIIFMFFLFFGIASLNKADAAERYFIYDDDGRNVVGDVYNPGHGRRLQIRDEDRNILGYINDRGIITDDRRNKRGAIGGLFNDIRERNSDGE